MICNYDVITNDNAFPIKLWTRGVQVEKGALGQLQFVSSLPFIFRHIAVMPDVHAGLGAVIGSVIPTVDVIVPAFVGADLSCGMFAIKTELKKQDLPKDYNKLFRIIADTIPHGRSNNGGQYDVGSWKENIPDIVEAAWMGIENKYKEICSKNNGLFHARAINQLGTVGTSNHFIEMCFDPDDTVWFMLHSGSRGPGAKIAQYFIQLAKKEMDKYYIKLHDANMAYLPEGTDLFDKYVEAAYWADSYATANREAMRDLSIRAFKKYLGSFHIIEEIHCKHNFFSKENHFKKNIWITRKGAISARKGQLGIIPGSMGAKSYIVRGLGNPESFCSASHGAGRLMSRTKAKETFTLKDHRAATDGIECLKDSSVLDETPGAYKPIDDVINAESDLVEVVTTLKQFICIKGAGE